MDSAGSGYPGPPDDIDLKRSTHAHVGQALVDADQWGLPYPAAGGLAAQPLPADRAEAERAFQLAEQLGSVNAAAAELGTTWPSLRKAFGRHGLGMPARNPEAVRQRAIAAAHQRTGRPVAPALDPVFVALNPGALPARERSPAELY
jgi:hypothetical protein